MNNMQAEAFHEKICNLDLYQDVLEESQEG
jgi:hypothetical protein